MKPHIKERLRKENRSKSTSLELQSGRINHFPLEVLEFEQLRSLNLFDNSLSELPDEFSRLSTLENLTISNNNFQVVPPTLLLLPSLKNLSARGNKITSIPYRLWSIPKIDLSNNQIDTIQAIKPPFAPSTEELNLRNNKLKNIPSALRSLCKLKKLILSNNLLESLKDVDFANMTELEELDLSHNQLTFLPSGIGQLTKLRILNLTGNKLKALPAEMESLIYLEHLEITGNQIPNAPIEIEAQGTKAVINYYLSLNEKIQLFEAKLLIVGQGGVGKTMLMQRLAFDNISDTATTEGIDIVQWNTKTPASDDFRVNIWDFGGQEIYHSTHQFFLTKRSLYLFVWEARRNGERTVAFDYWLNIIKLLSQDSPTIIVLNKIDERIETINEKGLVNKFSNIKSFHQVSARLGEHIGALAEEIRKYISQLPLVGNILPKVWVDIRKALENLKRPYIEFKEYLLICNTNGLDEKKALFLSQYFHDLGVFLHFQEDSILKHIVFLTPEWATNAVYRLIDAKPIISNYGEFSLGELENILDDYPEEKHLQLVRLMEKFELCLRLIDKNDHYLIPELLGADKPELIDDFSSGLKLEYRYSFMPAGILARCIVRLRNFIENKEFWKYGVVLKREDGKALIESDEFAKKIHISATGSDKATLLQIIQKEFDEIHRTLNCSETPSYIPCACGCASSENPHFFKYEFLKAASKTNKTVLCETSLQNVTIESMLSLYRLSARASGRQTIESERLKSDLIKFCSILLDRKLIAKENTHNDKLTDLLRAGGYYTHDQTRNGISGLSGTDSGELDMMIRDAYNTPLAIIECLKIDSCGSNNQVIAQHINKLLGDYDMYGLKRNFIVVYAQGHKFNKLWENYGHYMNKVNNHPAFSYSQSFPLISFDKDENAVGQMTSIKVGTARHLRDEEEVEIVHIMLNMNINK